MATVDMPESTLPAMRVGTLRDDFTHVKDHSG